jgi:CheY-like chemotaxis protein
MPTILIIEDEDVQRAALCNFIKQKGYSTVEAKDGMDGLEIALNYRPDLILMDVRMPKMDGMDVMHEIRKNEWGKKVPIIILTNYDINDTQLDRIVTDQPSYYLIKANSSLEYIFEKMKEVLNSKTEEA